MPEKKIVYANNFSLNLIVTECLAGSTCRRIAEMNLRAEGKFCYALFCCLML